MNLITHKLLGAYFTNIKTLRDYLSEIIQPEDGDSGSCSAFLPNETDSPSYRDLIETSYVGTKSPDVKRVTRFKVYPAGMYMRELIDKVQEQLLTRTNVKTQNIITSGYRFASKNGEYGKSDMSIPGITNFFVNTNVTALQAPEWETLLQRVGVDPIYHLLRETSVFVSLPNGNFCQVVGEPLLYKTLHDRYLNGPRKMQEIDKKRVAVSHEEEPPKKRLRKNNSNLSRSDSSAAIGTTPSRVTPSDINITRARLFYSRPSFVPKKNLIVVGLPPNHILNVINPSYEKKSKSDPETLVDPNPRKQADDSRHLAKYVFQRQYGFSSPFTTGKASKLRDYSNLEEEIKNKGACKTPQRLKNVLPILEKMIWSHGKCGYKPLLCKVCPSKIQSEGEKQLDSNVILELMSEPVYPRSQPSIVDISVDSVGCPITPRGLSQAIEAVKHKPKFAEFVCSHAEVYRYVLAVTNSVIPKIFWGSHSNFKIIMGHVKWFIACRRFETLSLHTILQGFSTSACDWLMPTSRGALKQSRVSVTDSLKRREILEEFIYWFFSSFLLPLLKTTFYVTESSAFRNQILYFRQDDWETLCSPLIDRLTSSTFQRVPKLEAEELLRQRKLGFSFVRLLPKDAGVRPIVNLGCRKSAKKAFYSELSINQILQAAFQILTYEKNAQSKRLGASIFGTNDVYPKLKSFQSKLPRDQNGKLPKLYFVKVDVQACFDNIEQTKLLEILRELISEDVYMMQKYGQVSATGGKVTRKYKKMATPEDEHPHFLKHAGQLAEVLHNTIFVDQVVYPYFKKQEILQLLEEHITENIVKIGQDYYRQMVGIPQGSVLSTLLCSFFYGDLEAKFTKFTEDPFSLLLRLIDDYLFISTSLEKARSFLSMMVKGHPEYGCFISKEKTMTNFDFDIEIMNVTEPHQRYFPWCGYVIDMEDLSVSVDYSRYRGISLSNSLTVDRTRRPGVSFLHKMLLLAKARSHILYCDTGFNTEETVHRNIYQNFVLSAMKMHCYLRIWGLDVTKNSTFIRNTIRRMILHTHTTIRNSSLNRIATAMAGKCNVQKREIIWLGTHAFHAVFSQRPQKYTSITKSLEFELSLGRHRTSRKRFRKVVREYMASMSEISF